MNYFGSENQQICFSCITTYKDKKKKKKKGGKKDKKKAKSSSSSSSSEGSTENKNKGNKGDEKTKGKNKGGDEKNTGKRKKGETEEDKQKKLDKELEKKAKKELNQRVAKTNKATLEFSSIHTEQMFPILPAGVQQSAEFDLKGLRHGSQSAFHATALVRISGIDALANLSSTNSIVPV